MKYSFALVFCVASLILQCSCRPQGLPVPEIPTAPEPSSTPIPPSSSSPAAETIMSDVETPTEVTNAGEQVVFDDAPASGSNQDDSESAGVTTDMPARSAEEMQADDAATTITPEMVIEEMADIISTNLPAGDAPAAPSAISSSDDDAEAGTTQSPASST